MAIDSQPPPPEPGFGLLLGISEALALLLGDGDRSLRLERALTVVADAAQLQTIALAKLLGTPPKVASAHCLVHGTLQLWGNHASFFANLPDELWEQWLEAWERNQLVVGSAEQLSSGAQEQLQAAEIREWLLVPVIAQGKLSALLLVTSSGTDTWKSMPVWEQRGWLALAAGLGAEFRRERAESIDPEVVEATKLDAVARLAGGIAHEYNNLLTVILARVQLAARFSHDTQALQAHLHDIREAANTAVALARQLLTFSRREKVKVYPVNLNELIEDLPSLLQDSLPSTIELDHHAGATHPIIYVDPGQLNQAVLHLVANAVEAMSDGGTLRIRSSNDGTPLNKVVLEVHDTGKGIEPAMISRIFEPFFSTKPHASGSGFGLSIAHGIITQNGGNLQVFSQPGQGTTLRLEFPLKPPPEDDVHPDSAHGLVGGNECILVVDDSPAVRRVTASLLERLGYRVLQATNGLEALRILAGERGVGVRLIISDMVMPFLGGASLAKRVRREYPDKRVLLMSGKEVSAQAKENFQVLSKPYSMEVLARTIRQVLDEN
jgi:signal transduction histidine kinase/CheY-like chemotaxis protein